MEETKSEVKDETPKKMRKEREAEKAAEEQAAKEAAEAQKIEEEKDTLRDKLINRKVKELQRKSAVDVRAITDKAKEISEPEKAAIERLKQSTAGKLREVRAEYEKAAKKLKAELERAEKELLQTEADAIAAVHHQSREKYQALEAEMAKEAEDRAATLQGFKDQLESASLEDLQKMWGVKGHDAQGSAEASA